MPDGKALSGAQLPVLEFGSAAEWRSWLESNRGQTSGAWLRFYKVGSAQRTFVYAEALDEALCFGWIDGQVKSESAESYLQKFTPRRARSLWSKRNREHIARLTAAGHMTPSGLAEVEAAKADGRWDDAYDSPSTTTVPDDFLAALSESPEAERFFATLDKANVYAITWRLQTAKRLETRVKRIQQFVAMLSRGEKLH